jgi:chromosome segregation ATPase
MARNGHVETQQPRCRCAARDVALTDREAAAAALERDGDLLRAHLADLSSQLAARASSGAAAAAAERQRAERDAARLDAAVAALEGQRAELATTLAAERESLKVRTSYLRWLEHTSVHG